MNIAFEVPSALLSRIEKREAAFWGMAAVAALVLHLAVFLTLLLIRPAGDSIGSPVAMMVEFASLPSASATESESLTSAEAQPDQTESVEDKSEPIEEVEKKVEPEPVPEEVQQEQEAKVEPEPEPVEEIIPDPVEAQTPEVNVPIPQPRPNIQNRPRPDRKLADQQQREKVRTADVARARSNPAPEGNTNRTQAARRGAGGVTAASWRNQLQAWLQQHKRYPSASRPLREIGTVELKFTIDPGGNVTSSRVSRSSGSPRLDQAALDMLHRASPVPPPPRSFDTASMLISLPVTFELR